MLGILIKTDIVINITISVLIKISNNLNKDYLFNQSHQEF